MAILTTEIWTNSEFRTLFLFKSGKHALTINVVFLTKVELIYNNILQEKKDQTQLTINKIIFFIFNPDVNVRPIKVYL